MFLSKKTQKIKNISINEELLSIDKLTSKQLWIILQTKDLNLFQKRCKYLLTEFGTTNRCNRFDVGNCLEFILADWIRSTGVEVENEPNSLRTDLYIKNYGKLSVKYSSSGNIKLHNSLGENKDMYMHPTLVIKPKKIYLISEELLKENGIQLSFYLKNVKDGLELRQSIFRILDNSGYFYKKDIDIFVSKEQCKHRMCAELVFQLKQYN